MQRMDAGGTLASRPSPNATSSPGWANNDPSGSSPPTIFDPDWANGIEAELEAIIAAGTGAALSKTATNQVLTAIQALVAQGQGGGQVQFNYSSATACILNVKNGCRLIIDGVGYQVPAAGINFPNTGVQVNGTNGQNLAASTVYYAAVYNNGGTLTPAFFTQASYSHAPDTTAGNVGTEVITSGGTPQSGYSLVGMLQTNASSQFQAGILTRSWFNRLQPPTSVEANSLSTSSTSAVDLGSAAHIPFLVWAGETALAMVDGFGGSNSGGGITTEISFDGNAPTGGLANSQGTEGSSAASITMATVAQLSEGLHTAEVWGYTQPSNTGTWNTIWHKLIVRG